MKAQHSGLISRPGTHRRYIERHKALGLCIHCSKKAEPGKRYCKFHTEYSKLYGQKRWKKMRKDFGGVF